MKHVGTENGLSQGSVHCMLQDHLGLMWLGTQEGLNCYDGVSFRNYKSVAGDSSTLSDDFITRVVEDGAGNVWVGTRNGLNRYDRLNDSFTRIFPDGMDPSFFHNTVTQMLMLNTYQIIFNFFNHYGIIDIDSVNASYRVHTFANADLYTSWLNVWQNKLLAVTPHEIRLYRTDSLHINNNGKQFCTLSGNDKMHDFVFTDHTGIIWICKNDTAKGISINNKERKYLSLYSSKVRSMNEDANGNLWVLGDAGLEIFTSTGARLGFFKYHADDPNGIKNNSSLCMYSAKSGLMWIGYSENGASVFNPRQLLFDVMKAGPRQEFSLSGEAAWSIFQHDSLLLVGTGTGMDAFISKPGMLSEHLPFQQNIIRKIKIEAGPDSMLRKNIRSIAVDKNGNFWIGTSSGIVILDKDLKPSKKIIASANGLSHNSVFHILAAKDGSMWVSTSGGLNHYLPDKNEWMWFQSDSAKPNSLVQNYVLRCTELSSGEIAVSTTGGFSILEPSSGKFQNVSAAPEKKDALNSNFVSQVYEDSKHRLWVCTLGSGFYLWNRSIGTFKNFTTHDGLINNVVYSTLEDQSGKLWLTTNNGLSCFDTETKVFRNFSPESGLPADEFVQNSLYKNKFGEIMAGSTEGLVIMNPARLQYQDSIADPVLTKLYLNYKAISAFKTQASKKIELYPSDKSIAFEFASPDFIAPGEITYQYQMLGFDEHSVIAEPGRRIATYTNLPYGKFHFVVKASKSGAVAPSLLSIEVVVIPPFWRQTWFILLASLIVLVLFTWLVRFISQRKLKKHLEEITIKQKLQNERERISRDLHDHVGSQLTYITQTLDSVAMNKDMKAHSLATEKLNQLSDFSRDVMQQLRDSIWAINKESITLRELRTKITDHLSRFIDPDSGIAFSVTFEGDTDPLLNPAHAIHLFRIVQEALNNSLKHASASRIDVSVRFDQKKLIVIEVKDNGKGTNEIKDMEGHYGLSNMKHRAVELGGSLDIESKLSGGTRVIIRVPV